MLILDHDDQLGEYKTLLNKITLDSINIRDANSLLMLQHLNNQKSLYDLYNELRKYKKELPPNTWIYLASNIPTRPKPIIPIEF